MNKSLNQQQRIATQPEVSARVMANAGAGKTFVLTARVLRLLLKGTHPGKILCLTYTKAAAAEMRERINSRLEEWVLMDDAALRANIANFIETEPDEQQMVIAKKLFSSTLESSPPPRIQTIHSFCQDVLKRFPLESGLAPYFEVVDDVTSRELIKETTQTLLSGKQVDVEVTDSINYIAANAGEKKFTDVIGEIISQRNRIIDLFETKPDITSRIYWDNGLEEGDSLESAVNRFMQFDTEKLATLKSLHSALESGGKRDGEHAIALAKALNTMEYNDYFNVFFGEKAAYTIKYFITKGALEKFAAGAEWILHEQQLLADMVKYENLEFTKHVINLAAGILGTYEAIKRNRAVIDYNDLIYTTKKLLTTGNNAAWVLYKLDGGIDHILIDEAQDTSPDQWQIVTALLEEFFSGEGAAKNGRTIFIVGDEKQSIYSFQGADQKAFNRTTNNIRIKCNDAQMNFSDLELKISFRSVNAILKLVDNVFEPDNLKKSVTSKEQISHELKRMGEGGRVELWPLVRSEAKEELENWSLPLDYISAKSADLLLAEKIADTISEWLKSGRKLIAKNRPIQPSDILILLRSRGELADMLINRLKRNNIEVSGSDRLKITEHIAIQDLMALANFLLLPSDDLSLACVLKSPLFGISEDDLFELAYKRESSIWNNLRNKPKFDAIYKSLNLLLDRVDYLSVYELYSIVLDQQGGRKKFISRLGHEVNDILDEFLDLSVNFERSHTNSLQQFISWVGLSNMEIKRDMESAGNQVRIMTVHGSKGLEAPIVFLADTAKLPTPKRQLVWNDDGYFYAYKTKSRIFPALKTAVENAEEADYDEYLRLLYVAITRARDELYIAGSMGERNSNIDKSWYKLVENSLAKFGIKNPETGVLHYETPHEIALSDIKEEKPAEKISMPEFLVKKLPNEKPQIVSVEDDEFNDLIDEINRGNKIHKTLEVIGQLAADKRLAYLQQQFRGDEATISNLMQVLNLENIFGSNSIAEVPVIGRVNGEVITGRIDRLVINHDEIIIIDFKTAKNIPKNIPDKYIKQLDAYRQIIAPQFEGKNIRAAILWVSGAKLEFI